MESFAADIAARNASDDTEVRIDNQLAPSDRCHLGQIMKNLVAVDARSIVWIAPRIREPHLSAVRWLNLHTAEDFSFVAVKPRVVGIGGSSIVPVFDVK